MRFIHVLSMCCLTVIVLLQSGCTGSDFPGPNASTTKTKYLDTKHVVSGTVYGDASKMIADVSSDIPTVPTGTKFFYNSSNKFVFTGYSTEKPNKGHLFSATFSDGSRLFSVWNGTESAVADVTVGQDLSSPDITYSLAVSPQEPAATVNINPVTNLAYWLWNDTIHDINHPFSDYLGNVFQFLVSQFPVYNLPIQNTVTDDPSPELLHLLDDISITVSSITVSDSNRSFTLTRKATGQIVCTGSIKTFPLCQ